MSDPGLEGLLKCRFYFEADEIERKYIKKISGLKVSNDPAGGGGAGSKIIGVTKNALVVRQATPTITKFDPITVEVITTESSDLYDWYSRCNSNDGAFNAWQGFRMNGSVTVYDQSGWPKARWEIKKTYPIQYQVSEFDVGSTEMLTETITLVHEGIIRVPVPDKDSMDYADYSVLRSVIR
jgi:phage tail-like protein